MPRAFSVIRHCSWRAQRSISAPQVTLITSQMAPYSLHGPLVHYFRSEPYWPFVTQTSSHLVTNQYKQCLGTAQSQIALCARLLALTTTSCLVAGISILLFNLSVFLPICCKANMTVTHLNASGVLWEVGEGEWV